MLLNTVIRLLVAALFPKAPAWLSHFLGQFVAAVVELVQDFMDADDLSGPAKFAEVTAGAKEILDETFDGVPEWRDLPEEKRDLIIDGVTEFVVFIVKVGGKAGGRKTLRKLSRTLRK